MSLYDRPAWQLLQDAIAELGTPFAATDVLQWFQQRYPRVTTRTIRQYMRAFSANDGTKRYMPSLPKNVLIKIGRGQYRLYDPDKDGLYDELGRPVGGESDEIPDEPDDLAEESAQEFELELHLEEFLQKNWSRIDFGRPLKLYSGADGQGGRQFQTAIGTIDFLCQDSSNGNYVVVELKKGRSSDAALGQCQRYMGWVKQHLAQPGQGVDGLIIAAERDEKLRYALLATAGVAMRCFQVSFRLFDPDQESSSD